jgi:hypothetical protein
VQRVRDELLLGCDLLFFSIIFKGFRRKEKEEKRKRKRNIVIEFVFLSTH